MRNPPVKLSIEEDQNTWRLANDIRRHDGRVRIAYTKRNGERKVYVGGFDRLIGTKGTDKFSANIVTEDGVKTLNLSRIDTLTLLEKES